VRGACPATCGRASTVLPIGRGIGVQRVSERQRNIRDACVDLAGGRTELPPGGARSYRRRRRRRAAVAAVGGGAGTEGRPGSPAKSESATEDGDVVVSVPSLLSDRERQQRESASSGRPGEHRDEHASAVSSADDLLPDRRRETERDAGEGVADQRGADRALARSWGNGVAPRRAGSGRRRLSAAALRAPPRARGSKTRTWSSTCSGHCSRDDEGAAISATAVASRSVVISRVQYLLPFGGGVDRGVERRICAVRSIFGFVVGASSAGRPVSPRERLEAPKKLRFTTARSGQWPTPRKSRAAVGAQPDENEVFVGGLRLRGEHVPIDAVTRVRRIQASASSCGIAASFDCAGPARVRRPGRQAVCDPLGRSLRCSRWRR